MFAKKKEKPVIATLEVCPTTDHFSLITDEYEVLEIPNFKDN
jgi:hypothetical protein